MKDIELDQVSSSNVVSRIQSAESEDQMLKLWETAERECSNLASNGHEVLPSEEAVGGHLQHIDEKELGVDKQEISNEIKESQVEWKREVFERLNSASKKLSDIQTSVEKLKSKISKCRRHISSELDDILPKLKETEEQISQLFNVEGMLRRKVEDEYCEQSNNNEEVGVLQRSQDSEQARIIMEQIEKLEVELEKTHHVFLKIEKECVNTTTQRSIEFLEFY
ncbi:hypothetical protein HPP92_023236 [Vanilla planifolia]|uniref:Uncharacterized protein n=1 Tax=Vanilla planifolia TaxID=51239 RepID=A0A835PW77_VANPL|nr:hypothetical protein HPP92_023236 [Vanilla planifolia]